MTTTIHITSTTVTPSLRRPLDEGTARRIADLAEQIETLLLDKRLTRYAVDAQRDRLTELREANDRLTRELESARAEVRRLKREPATVAAAVVDAEFGTGLCTELCGCGS